MALKADVNKLMGGDLGNWLDDQQTMRAEAKKKAHSRWTTGSAILLPVLAFLWFGPNWDGSLKFFLSIFGGGGVWMWGYQPIQKAKREIKIGINAAIANDLGLNYDHDLEPGHEFELAKTFELLPSYQRARFEDHWYGELEGHEFGLYEAHLEVRRGSGKNRRWVTVFRGAIIRMEFGRNFHSTTLLQRAGKNKKWLGLGGRKDSIKLGEKQMGYVDQVHPAFENVFEVWSDDQVEARVLVHPTYVEHLIALETTFKGDAVRALFSGGEVIIAVQSGNLFESGHIDAEGDSARATETAEHFATLGKLALAINQNERGQAKAEPESIDAATDIAPDPVAVKGFGRKGL
ncbi:MAG: DUF3137 domain-containing protein [Erythrobacter sp.]